MLNLCLVLCQHRKTLEKQNGVKTKKIKQTHPKSRVALVCSVALSFDSLLNGVVFGGFEGLNKRNVS